MGCASWKFGKEKDGRVFAEVTVGCYGVDALDAAAQCVKHALIDVAAGIWRSRRTTRTVRRTATKATKERRLRGDRG